MEPIQLGSKCAFLIINNDIRRIIIESFKTQFALLESNNKISNKISNKNQVERNINRLISSSVDETEYSEYIPVHMNMSGNQIKFNKYYLYFCKLNGNNRCYMIDKHITDNSNICDIYQVRVRFSNNVFNNTIIEGLFINTFDKIDDSSNIKNIFSDIYPSIKLETTLPSSFNISFDDSKNKNNNFKSSNIKASNLKLSKESKLFNNQSSKTVWLFMATDIYLFNSNPVNQSLSGKIKLLEKIFGIYYYPDPRIDICSFQVIQLIENKTLSNFFKYEQFNLPFKLDQHSVIYRN